MAVDESYFEKLGDEAKAQYHTTACTKEQAQEFIREWVATEFTKTEKLRMVKHATTETFFLLKKEGRELIIQTRDAKIPIYPEDSHKVWYRNFKRMKYGTDETTYSRILTTNGVKIDKEEIILKNAPEPIDDDFGPEKLYAFAV